eukprot:CAMPEP_0170641428 /NCGR_PEP_ID=MMETSP0224-20130122/40757_1 /TAXON_ID=285029 /ORGANISM="Togula jolla, Strain CCCM 725" /LENGTH=222 /DNA_ID=CAMNT_0010972009 /DNA_START=17 /DNA_END=682 /DNA_ORIENTATION=+
MAEPARGPNRKVNGKVIIAGPANAGKTCLIERFVSDKFAGDDATHGPTVGCECQQKSLHLDDKEVLLYLYDTAGQERFAEMAAGYYRIGDVCLLCFDMSNVSSFDKTTWWMRKVRDHNERCLFILVGTKEDLVEEGRSSSESLKSITKWAEENGIPFFPTSALKGGYEIRFLFHTVAEKCVRVASEREHSKNSKAEKLDREVASAVRNKAAAEEHLGRQPAT